MFGNLGMGEILIILVLILVLFGPRKIPELAHTLGRGLSEFRRQVNEAQRAISDPGLFQPGDSPHDGYGGQSMLGSGTPPAPPPLTPEEERAREPKRLLE